MLTCSWALEESKKKAPATDIVTEMELLPPVVVKKNALLSRNLPWRKSSHQMMTVESLVMMSFKFK